MARKSERLLAKTEEAWSKDVEKCARNFGWEFRYHTVFSLGSSKGFPDWCFCKPGNAHRNGRLVFAELKSDDGEMTPEQEAWFQALRQVRGIEVYCWRPRDWSLVVQILSDGQAEGR